MATPKNKMQNSESPSAGADWYSYDPAITCDYDGTNDFSDDEPVVEFREGIARAIHEGHTEPGRDLIAELHAAVAAKWHLSILDVSVAITRSIYRHCFDIYFVNVRRWPGLANLDIQSNEDSYAVAVLLYWHAGEQLLVDAIPKSSWLVTQPPTDVPRHYVDSKVLPYLTVTTGLLDHWLSPSEFGGGGATDDIEDRIGILHEIRGTKSPVERVPLHMLLEDTGNQSQPCGDDRDDASKLWTDIYRIKDVETAIKGASDYLADKGKRAQQLKIMLESGGKRPLAPAPTVQAILEMRLSHPNFRDVIEFIAQQVALCHLREVPAARFDPILLLGSPGIGKTHFANNLARVLGTPFEFISMGSLTAGWILSGTSSIWGSARSGKIADVLISRQYANPLIVLDEIDKSAGDSRYDPLGALYALLERDTARRFCDEYIEVKIDTSHVMWIATANQASLPDPILNRFKVFTIEPAEGDALKKIIENAYGSMTEEFGDHFDRELHPNVMERLLLHGGSTRDICALLRAGLGRAALAGRNHIDHVDLSTVSGKRRSIGFCA